jgi:hypothetical protein
MPVAKRERDYVTSSAAWAKDIAVAVGLGSASAIVRTIESIVERIIATSRLDQAALMHRSAREYGAPDEVMAVLDRLLADQLRDQIPGPVGREDLLRKRKRPGPLGGKVGPKWGRTKRTTAAGN